MPVQLSNCAHDLLSESDSGGRIEPNIVTVLPLTVTFTGLPAEPRMSPLTGHTRCFSAAARSATESSAKPLEASAGAASV